MIQQELANRIRKELTRGVATILLATLASCAWAQSHAGLWSKAVPRVDGAPEFFVSPEGQPGNAGTKGAPWDIGSALAGRQKVPPGSTVWLRKGKYLFPARDSVKGGNGFAVRLGGAESRPVHVRAWPGERATIDGGLEVSGSHLWLWDLEIALSDDWRPREPSPQGANTRFGTPTGVLNVNLSRQGVKIINCISHNNHMGLGFWKHVKNGEVHGCIVYDNGFLGADRPHGPAVYTQNQTGTPRLITDNILGGNYSLPLQAYGSNMSLMVRDFSIEGNIIWAPRREARGRTYAICGGPQSRNIVVHRNFIYGHELRVGRKANQAVEGNVIVRGDFCAPSPENNTIILRPAADTPPLLWLRPNRYDPRRANLLVSNWTKADTVEVDLSSFLKRGDGYRVLSPFDFYGKPLIEGIHCDKPVSLPPPTIPWTLMTGDPRELGVFIIMKATDDIR